VRSSNLNPAIQHTLWRRRKSRYVRIVPLRLHRGVSVSRGRSSSMISNTCCTALLLQGAPPDGAATPT
jgi:hypothetical protein